MNDNKQLRTTSPFGLQHIDAQVKTDKVQDVFDSVASRYDLMNDLMSIGSHRLWKQYFVGLINYTNLSCIVDVACGSGDVLIAHAKKSSTVANISASRSSWANLTKETKIIGIDPNPNMLRQAKYRLDEKGLFHIELQQATAEKIPLEDASVDCVTTSFGLRNTTDMSQALAEMFRVLRIGGRLLILEFSHVVSPFIARMYRTYARCILYLGKMVTKDKDSYQYLIDSIATHPNQPTLQKLLESTGFSSVHWINLCNGVVAIHSGYKT